jgi:ribosomal protein L24E
MRLCEQCGANVHFPEGLIAVNRGTGQEVSFCSSECANDFVKVNP